MSIVLALLVFLILALQLYLIYLFVQVISNAARFVLLISVFTIVGSVVPSLLPGGNFSIRTPDYLYANFGFRMEYEGWLQAEFAPVYFYLILLALSIVSLLLVPRYDDALATRQRTRELWEVEKKRLAVADPSSKATAE